MGHEARSAREHNSVGRAAAGRRPPAPCVRGSAGGSCRSASASATWRNEVRIARSSAAIAARCGTLGSARCPLAPAVDQRRPGRWRAGHGQAAPVEGGPESADEIVAIAALRGMREEGRARRADLGGRRDQLMLGLAHVGMASSTSDETSPVGASARSPRRRARQSAAAYDPEAVAARRRSRLNVRVIPGGFCVCCRSRRS